VIDRCVQAMVKNALEPSWEARFEGCSYGFRPGRGCHDAIEKIYGLARPNKRKKWVFDADIKGAFDNISHEHLLTTIGRVPGIELIRQWLKAGYVDKGVFHETEAGTPQVVDWLKLRRDLSVGSSCVEHSAKIFEGRKFDATSTRFLIS
jgi:RNA-directed DNA polymerase